MQVQTPHHILLTYRHDHIHFQHGRREAEERRGRRTNERTSEPDRDTECASEHRTPRAPPRAHPCYTPHAVLPSRCYKQMGMGSRSHGSSSPSRSRPVSNRTLKSTSTSPSSSRPPPLPALRLPAPIATHQHLRRGPHPPTHLVPAARARRPSRRRRANVPLPPVVSAPL